MNTDGLTITSAIVQLATRVVFAPVVLIVGLLSFPTICHCGADLPHGHALYTLDGHTHATVASGPERESPQATAALEARPDRPVLQVPAPTPAGQGIVAIIDLHAAQASPSLQDALPEHSSSPPGHPTIPDTPPPRA